MKITIEDPSESELREMLWGQAVENFDEICKADKFDALCQYIDDVYYDGIDMTGLNDILAYDWEQLFKDIGMFDLEDVLYKNYLADFKKDCETYKKTNIPFEDMLENEELSGSELEERNDEIKDKISECLDAIDEVYDAEDYDDFESAKDDLETSLDELKDLLTDYVDENSKIYEALYVDFSDFFSE